MKGVSPPCLLNFNVNGPALAPNIWLVAAYSLKPACHTFQAKSRCVRCPPYLVETEMDVRFRSPRVITREMVINSTKPKYPIPQLMR